MQSSTSIRCSCPCGWYGTVGDCEPDIDGDGSLGCPECDAIITVYGPAQLGTLFGYPIKEVESEGKAPEIVLGDFRHYIVWRIKKQSCLTALYGFMRRLFVKISGRC